MFQKLSCVLIVASGVIVQAGPRAVAQDFATTVESTNPLAYFRLDATSGRSAVGTATYRGNSGVTVASGGAPTGASQYASFDGKSGLITTTQKGGIKTEASIMAWVNLAELPSKTGRLFYLAGESESGNDLDLQIETDDYVRFFTAGGGNVQFALPKSEALNRWHMVVATLNTVTKARAIYWDGKQVARDLGGGRADKTQTFTIGESVVFSQRFFHGGIQDVALWNRALTASQVAEIYAAANGASGSAAGAGAARSAGSSASAAAGGLASAAKVEVSDAKGPIQLKREEQIALMVLSDIEVIERECQMSSQPKACSMSELMTTAAGREHLKLDPNKSDANYTYTLASGGMAWEAHANAKKPGLKGFCFMSRSIGTTVTTYSSTGKSGWTDTDIGNRGIEGDTFRVQ